MKNWHPFTLANFWIHYSTRFFSPYGFWIFGDSVIQQQQRSISSKKTLFMSNKGCFVVLKWGREGHGTDRHTYTMTLQLVDKTCYDAGQVEINMVYLKWPVYIFFFIKGTAYFKIFIKYPNSLIGRLNSLNKMLLYFGQIQWEPHTWLMAVWRYMVECL